MKKSVSEASRRKSRAPKPKDTILPAQPAIGLPQGYIAVLSEIKQRVHRAQVRASLSANVELVSLYWDIGRMILNRQSEQGWGAKVIDRLAADLQTEFPGRQGFSPRNLKYMRAFAEAWPEGLLGEQTAFRSPGRTANARRASAQAVPIVQAPLAQLPWYHHTILLNKLQNADERRWYAQAALDQGWSGNILALQIDSGLHLRQGKATTNFKSTLPPDQSDLAQSVTKDPYLFDFLGLTGPTNERAIEDGLIVHVEKFLLELGNGFALVGRQMHLEIGEQDFYLDLLFYHWKLRAFIVIDLKAREFTPEAAGKMNFYLSAVDDLYKQPGDQPSLGLILCRNKNRVLAEYALRDMTKPIGVSGYVTELVDSLPKNLRGTVPTVEEIETELSR